MKMNKLGAASVLALTLGATSAMAECGEVSITEMDWASSQVVTAVSAFLLQQGLGCDVQKVPSSTVPALTSLAETGEPDILTEVWANSTPSYEPLLAEGKLVEMANVLSDGGVEAWWIPAYLAETNPELRHGKASWPTQRLLAVSSTTVHQAGRATSSTTTT